MTEFHTFHTHLLVLACQKCWGRCPHRSPLLKICGNVCSPAKVWTIFLVAHDNTANNSSRLPPLETTKICGGSSYSSSTNDKGLKWMSVSYLIC